MNALDHAPSSLDPRRFGLAWRALGVDSDGPYALVASRYAEAHRAYHTAEHINECLGWSDGVRDQALRPAELEIAIYFHDLVYEPQTRDNERRSAELFREEAASAGVAAPLIERIEKLIESTEKHAIEGADAALLSDIDLSILGASPTRYMRFERDIRTEYAMFDDATYRAGRANVLRGFLERLGIYKTASFASRLEAQARDNISRALSALECHP